MSGGPIVDVHDFLPDQENPVCHYCSVSQQAVVRHGKSVTCKAHESVMLFDRDGLPPVDPDRTLNQPQIVRKKKKTGPARVAVVKPMGAFPCKAVGCDMCYYKSGGGANKHMRKMQAENCVMHAGLVPYPPVSKPKKVGSGSKGATGPKRKKQRTHADDSEEGDDGEPSEDDDDDDDHDHDDDADDTEDGEDEDVDDEDGEDEDDKIVYPVDKSEAGDIVVCQGGSGIWLGKHCKKVGTGIRMQWLAKVESSSGTQWMEEFNEDGTAYTTTMPASKMIGVVKCLRHIHGKYIIPDDVWGHIQGAVTKANVNSNPEPKKTKQAPIVEPVRSQVPPRDPSVEPCPTGEESLWLQWKLNQLMVGSSMTYARTTTTKRSTPGTFPHAHASPGNLITHNYM